MENAKVRKLCHDDGREGRLGCGNPVNNTSITAALNMTLQEVSLAVFRLC